MRRPKGTYVRNSPDWNYRNLAFASAAAQYGAGTDSYVGLYNDATDGSTLHVMAVSVEMDTGSSTSHVIGFIEQGLTNATLWMHGRAVRLDQPQPPGSAYSRAQASNAGQQAIFLGGYNQGLWVAPGWPLWILPPNYMLWFQANHGDGVFIGATWWYLWLRE